MHWNGEGGDDPALPVNSLLHDFCWYYRWQCDLVPLIRWLHQSLATVLDSVVPRSIPEFERLYCVKIKRERLAFEFRLSTRSLSVHVSLNFRKLCWLCDLFTDACSWMWLILVWRVFLCFNSKFKVLTYSGRQQTCGMAKKHQPVG